MAFKIVLAGLPKRSLRSITSRLNARRSPKGPTPANNEPRDSVIPEVGGGAKWIDPGSLLSAASTNRKVHEICGNYRSLLN
jgi:hypothetical protein